MSVFSNLQAAKSDRPPPVSARIVIFRVSGEGAKGSPGAVPEAHPFASPAAAASPAAFLQWNCAAPAAMGLEVVPMAEETSATAEREAQGEPAQPISNGASAASNGQANPSSHANGSSTVRPAVVGLQPVALVDHIALVDWSVLTTIPGERGGSMRVSDVELSNILQEVNAKHRMGHGIRTIAGGSVANTIRGLAYGLHVGTALVGVRGCDDLGHMFAGNMAYSGVDLSRLRSVPGLTAQCACLVDADGNRTMRPCFINKVRLEAKDLTVHDFRGSKWVVMNGYGFYVDDLLETTVDLCKQEGVKVSMDLASFEVVRLFRPRLMGLLESGKVDLVFANEDEAGELIKDEQNPCPETCLNFLSRYCERAVVMLGPKGCIARLGDETVRVPAIKETTAVDTTGAGDLFASGFLYGILNGLSLEDCCKMGCCTGGAVVRGLGGEVSEEGWEWMQEQLRLYNLPAIDPPFRNL